MNLKIATLNFWGLPCPLSINKKQRLKKLINLIKDEKIDILALQEIWLNKDIKYIKSKLPNYHILINNNLIFNFSGLLLLSKFPLLENKFHKFKISKEFPSKKGIQKTKIKIFNKEITLLNIHLDYSSNQLSQIKKNQIKHITKTLDNSPTLILGDFNTDLPNFNIPDNFKLISQTETKTLNSKNHYVTKRFNKFHETDWLCDLIFCNFKAKLTKKKIIKKPLISDHYLVISEIHIPNETYINKS